MVRQRVSRLLQSKLVLTLLLGLMWSSPVLISLLINQPDNLSEYSKQEDLSEDNIKMILLPGKPFQTKIGSGEQHIYKFSLEAGQYVEIFSKSWGIDLEYQLITPWEYAAYKRQNIIGDNYQEFAKNYYKNLRVDRESSQLFMIAQLSGDYWLKVRQNPRITESSLDRREVKKTVFSRYELTLKTVEVATEEQKRFVTDKSYALEANQRGQADEGSRATANEEMPRTTQRTYQLMTTATSREIENASTIPEKSKRETIAKLQKILLYYREQREIKNTIITLNRIGEIYQSLGEKESALEVFRESRILSQQIGDKQTEAITLTNMGRIYYNIGEKNTALYCYYEALKLSEEIQDKKLEAVTLSDLGLIYHDYGEKEDALKYLNQSLALSREFQDKFQEAITLNYIGLVYNDEADLPKALDYYNESLSLSQELGDKAIEGITFTNIGRVYLGQGKKDQALLYLNRALPLSQEVNDKEAEASILYSLAFLKGSQGNLMESLTDIKAAIAIIEDIRSKIDSEKLRQSFLSQVQNEDSYRFYIDLLMQLHQQKPAEGYDEQAFNASEYFRARTLLEILAEADPEVRAGIDTQLLERQRNLQEDINATASRQIELLSEPHTSEEALTLQQNLGALLLELDEIKAKIRKTSPQYASIPQPQPLSVEQIQQQVLDENTLLLQYSLGQNRSFLWAVTSDSLNGYELPPQADIEKAARAFRDTLTTPSQRERQGAIAETSALLSNMILGPVRDRLKGKRVVIVGEGILHYIPFAALSVSGPPNYQPLIATNEVVTLPSASSLAVLRKSVHHRPVPQNTIAILADPVFSAEDPRVPPPPHLAFAPSPYDLVFVQAAPDIGISGNLERLIFTRQEAEAIRNLLPSSEQKFTHLDFDANLETVTSPELSQSRIVHFATHGFVNSLNPELSGLVLSLFDKDGDKIEGVLRLHDIFSLNLNADLVVVSACKTALGREIKGEGVVALTRGFMYAGTPRVVVSLWSVDDESTSVLMSKFYEKMLSQNLTPAQALRQAQLEMSQTQEWKSPYFWAGFTLQGEWR